MLDQHGLWIISEFLGIGSLFLGFQQGVGLRIILFIAGCASLLVGVLALCKEVEFTFASRGASCFAGRPFIGGLFSVANLLWVICDTVGEIYAGTVLFIYIAVLVIAIMFVVKRF